MVHEGRLPPTDVILVADVPVTSQLRTLIDLLLFADRYSECHTWMGIFAAAAPELLAPAQEQLSNRPRLPGRRAALERVERLSEAVAHDEVTR